MWNSSAIVRNHGCANHAGAMFPSQGLNRFLGNSICHLDASPSPCPVIGTQADADAVAVAASFDILTFVIVCLLAFLPALFKKGQCDTDVYRFMVSDGGFVWIVTQATLIYDKNNSNRSQTSQQQSSTSSSPQCVVCVHYVNR
ncbi:Hypoxia-inducible factor 1-alpha [Nymphon striatum]|nr:Hypoxia-inducible factor 1-alpha [Nymphon striatum]